MGGKPKVTVAVDRAVVEPGGSVQVTAQVDGDLSEVTDLEVGVVCEGLWKMSDWETDSSKRQLRHWGDVRPVPIAPGAVVLTFALPADAPPTTYSHLSHTVRWTAFVTARGKRFAHAAAPFVVPASRAPCYARESLAPEVTTPNDALAMTIDVPRCTWTGYPIDATVTVHALAGIVVERVTATLSMTTIRASAEQPIAWSGELRHSERPDGCRHGTNAVRTEKIKGETRIDAGGRSTFPVRFDAPVPSDGMLPSLATPLARLHWLVTVEIETVDHGTRTETIELNLLSEPAPGYR